MASRDRATARETRNTPHVNGQQNCYSIRRSATHHRVDEENDEGGELDVRDDFYPLRNRARYYGCCRRWQTKKKRTEKKNKASR